MKRKRIIIVFLVTCVLLGGGLYAYSEFNRKVSDLRKVDADLQVEAQQLFTAFEKDEAGSNARFLDKIIAVSGKVKSVEQDATGHYTVILGDGISMSSVRCAMDSAYQQEVTGLEQGMGITLKGACAGFNADELLGSDVILNRCVVEQ